MDICERDLILNSSHEGYWIGLIFLDTQNRGVARILIWERKTCTCFAILTPMPKSYNKSNELHFCKSRINTIKRRAIFWNVFVVIILLMI